MCLRALLVLVAALPALAGPGPGGPGFSARQQLAVAARAGDTAALRCVVHRLGERTVSWVRSRDLQILTHAGLVFTADSRVSCSEAPAGAAAPALLTSRDEGGRGTAVHTLRVQRLRETDSGRYECQVNTEPKMSLFFNLTVVAESALPVVVVRALGTAAAGQLACEARYELSGGGAPAPELAAALPPLRIRWTRDGETLDPQSGVGGISLETERWAGGAVSRLTLAGAGPGVGMGGRYVCSAGGRSATLLLPAHHDPGDYQVIDAAEGAAEWMQRDQAVARVSAHAQHGRRARALLACLCALLAALLT